MNILVINHSVVNCGVYQYGKRVGNILSKSTNNNFIYLELNSHEELDEAIEKYFPRIIIYNYLAGTMPWVNSGTVSNLRQRKIKQGLIVHNVGYDQFFDFYLHQDPYFREYENNFAILRPLFEYQPAVKAKEDSDVIKIGSFGFGFRVKHFDDICNSVNHQLGHKKVQLNLHLTTARFAQNFTDEVQRDCRHRITSPSIDLNFTTEFISDSEMLDFLYNNDLNIFFYEKYNSYNGISSTIDYALSVRKPIAICISNMFSHIYDAKPSICVEENSLESIIQNGFTPLQDKVDSWSHEKFINKIEQVIQYVI